MLLVCGGGVQGAGGGLVAVCLSGLRGLRCVMDESELAAGFRVGVCEFVLGGAQARFSGRQVLHGAWAVRA